MNHDAVMRRVLAAAALFNLGAAGMVLFPNSLGRFADLPVGVPRFHSGLLAVFILLFAGAYAWLSRQPVIDRPLVAMAIVGKTGVFGVALACFLLGEISTRSLAPAVMDLMFGLAFWGWYRATPPPRIPR